MSRVLNHIGISGGKDSTALLLWAVHESGYPKESLIVSFCDTGNEAPETYDFVAMLSEKVHPVTTIKPERDFWELAKYKKRFPSARARFCTEELKMKPTKTFVQAFAAIGIEVVLHSGVRAAESEDRAKLPERELSLYFGMTVFRPLLQWTIEDVWAIHKRYDIAPNPLYSMGCARVGCLPCIMSRKREIANIAQRWPERIDFIRSQEGAVRNGCGYSSMFARDRVPDRYRTKEITTAPRSLAVKQQASEGQEVIPLEDVRRTHIEGQKMRVCTIDDVVRWAINDPAIYEEEFDFFEDAPACDSRYGACE